jgi:endoglycosylceramidase
LALAFMLPASAAAEPREPLGHEGRWITDADGRTVILHGVAVVVGGAFGLAGGDEMTAAEVGFSQADADLLASEGFNVVRLGMFFRGYSPDAGVYDDAYLQSFVGTHRQLAADGIHTLVDFHQDQLAPRYNGRGFPDWFLIDDGFPNGQQPFPQGYFVNPALNRAYDNLWANAAGPGGVGLQDRFADGWARVAAAFAGEDRVLGYDIFNEPWPGTTWPTCANPVGCPPGGFDQTLLTAFSNRIIAAIRGADPDRLAFYEPNLMFDVGAQTQHGQAADPNVGMSFHNYCLGAAPGLPQIPDPVGACEDIGETLVFQNADAHSAQTGAALLMTEFGDTEDPAIHSRVADLADRFMVGWTDWAYMGSTGQIKIDNAAPPTPDNIRQARLDAVVRAYPRVVAGTPLRYGYEPEERRLEAVWSTELPGGGTAGALESEIFVPQRHYGDDYRVELSGAEVVSGLGTQELTLRNCPGAATVQVVVTAEKPAAPSSCIDQGVAAGARPGGPCANRIVGTPRRDRLVGTAAPDFIVGLGERDRLGGGPGDDCLSGNRGGDRLRGGPGFDLLRGGADPDRIGAADGGPDIIYCGSGEDRVRADERDRLKDCERIR